MCNPVLIGIGAGAAIGGIRGGPRGALLGGALGGLGGWGFSALGGAAGSQILLAGDVLSQAPVAASGGIFGSIGSFFTSPQFSLGSKLIGFGVQMVGAQQQAAFQRAQIAFQQAALRNRQIAVEQDIKARQVRLQVQKGIIGAQGAQARGQLRAEQAGRGVLVDVGSAAEATKQLAGDVAFAKLIKEQEAALQDRQDRIIASGIGIDSALLDFQLAEGQRASVFGQAGTAFKAAAGFSKFRFNREGQLAFA
jgi:hypothetical protein